MVYPDYAGWDVLFECAAYSLTLLSIGYLAAGLSLVLA